MLLVVDLGVSGSGTKSSTTRRLSPSLKRETGVGCELSTDGHEVVGVSACSARAQLPSELAGVRRKSRRSEEGEVGRAPTLEPRRGLEGRGESDPLRPEPADIECRPC